MDSERRPQKVIHILDDIALGGVTRLLDSLLPALGDGFDHRRVNTRTRYRLPPRLDADIVVIHFTAAWNKMPFLLGLRRACPGARILLVEHSYTGGFERLNVKSAWRFHAMLRLAYGSVERVVAVSRGQKRWMLESRLARPEQVVAIPCVLDLEPFLRIAPPAPRTGPMRLGAFGRYSRQKGFDTLIEAMRLVAPDRAHLSLAGYGEDEEALRAAAAGLPNVTMEGRVDPVEFLSRMDAIAMPSRWEAGAVSCWELRAAARPAIVSDVDGLPEQMPRERGLIVPPENPARLAAAIDELAGLDRAAMSANARASTLGAFDEVVAAWKKLLEGGPV